MRQRNSCNLLAIRLVSRSSLGGSIGGIVGAVGTVANSKSVRVLLPQALFELLSSNGYRLTEAEVKVFMPGLVEKCGQPQPNVRGDCRWVWH
mgnify:CR=1 FL=1